MSRVIVDLLSAQRSDRPHGLPKGRPRGAKRLGIRYEAQVGKALPAGAQAGVWWAYVDANGPGVCQTDWLVEGPSATLVIECKLGQNAEAWGQLESLYVPVVQRALGKPVLGVQVCKFLRGEEATPGEVVVHSLNEAVPLARAGLRPVVHWSGLGPLWVVPARGHFRSGRQDPVTWLNNRAQQALPQERELR